MTARASQGAPDLVHFWCPGCDGAHQIRTGVWSWNGDLELPTFTPSVLVTSTWGNGRRREDDPEYVETTRRCHSFVTDGRIQFLTDCTHALASQTVDLPDWPHD